MYKVAELLRLSSQEAMALLREETGIDVKSASSSIEEIVARQFVERQARKRDIALPGGPLFADSTSSRRSKGKGAPEPPKPPKATLRPRLVKTHKPVEVPEAPSPESEPETPTEAPAPAGEAAAAAPTVAAPETAADEPAAAAPPMPAAPTVPAEAPAPPAAAVAAGRGARDA